MYNNQSNLLYNPYNNASLSASNAASLSAVSARSAQYAASTVAAAAPSLAPVADAPLNHDPNPIVVHKKSAPVQYTQNVSVRFLKPPPLPPQGKVIVKQEPDIILPPPPPLIIRKYHRLAKVSPNAPPTAAQVNIAPGQQFGPQFGAAFAGQFNQGAFTANAFGPAQGLNGFAPSADFNFGNAAGLSAQTAFNQAASATYNPNSAPFNF